MYQISGEARDAMRTKTKIMIDSGFLKCTEIELWYNSDINIKVGIKHKYNSKFRLTRQAFEPI